jgi:hypothetical protein
MIVHAEYSIENSTVNHLFKKFLNKLPAFNIEETDFDVDLEEAKIKIGELLYVLHSMIDRSTDSIVVEYEIMDVKMRSRLGIPFQPIR